jgi:hypothetical protein
MTDFSARIARPPRFASSYIPQWTCDVACCRFSELRKRADFTTSQAQADVTPIKRIKGF